MKIIAVICIVLVSLFADLLSLGANFGIWNPQQVYLDFPLLALVICIISNYLILKIFTQTARFNAKLFSFVVILINTAFITTFLTSIDGSSVHIFGLNLIGLGGATILPYFFFPKYLFIFPLIMTVFFGLLSSSQKKKGLIFYPYLTLCIFSIFVSFMYLLNLNFFYNLFHFSGVTSHVFSFGIYFLLELVVSLFIAYLITKHSPQAKY